VSGVHLIQCAALCEFFIELVLWRVIDVAFSIKLHVWSSENYFMQSGF